MAESRRIGQAAPEQPQFDLSQPEPAARRTDPRHCSLRSSFAESGDDTTAGAAHPPCHLAAELLQTPGAVLTRSHLRELGCERRGVDAIFRALPVVAVDGYSQPVIRVDDYLELIARQRVARESNLAAPSDEVGGTDVPTCRSRSVCSRVRQRDRVRSSLQCQTTLNSAVAHNGTFVRFPSGTEVASFARFETTWPPSHCRRTLISSRYAVEHRACGCALAIGECFCAR